jgi:hypothetical protein
MLFGEEARLACDLKEGHAGPHEEYPKPAAPKAVNDGISFTVCGRREVNIVLEALRKAGWKTVGDTPASLRDKAIDAPLSDLEVAAVRAWLDYNGADINEGRLTALAKTFTAACRAAVAARKEGKP